MSNPLYYKFDNPALETSPRDQLFDPTIRMQKNGNMATQLTTFKHSSGNTLSARLTQVQSLFSSLCNDVLEYSKESTNSKSQNEVQELARNLGLKPTAAKPEKMISEMHKIIQPAGLNELSAITVVDFKYTSSASTFSEQLVKFLLSVLREKGAKVDASKLSRDHMEAVQRLVNDVTKHHSVKIGHPMSLKDYFKQQYILGAFVNYQDEIRWCTDDGTPTDNMAIFWDQPPAFRTQAVRNKAYQQKLFKERKNIKRGIAPCDFLPPIYCKVKDRWRLVKFELNRPKEFSLTTQVGLPLWLNDENMGCRIRRAAGVDLVSYLNDANEEFTTIDDQTPDKVDSALSNARNVVYMYVVHDDTLTNYIHGTSHYGSWPPSSVQVYIGMASNGLMDKWLKGPNSHAQIAARVSSHMESLNRVYDPYHPLKRDSSPDLVDSLLALSVVENFNHAVFILNTLPAKMTRNNLQKAIDNEVKQHLANDPMYGINM